MKIQLLIIGLSAILGCSTKDTGTSSDEERDQDTSDIHSNQDRTEILFLKNVIAHHFSSPTVKDTFKIKLTGQTITEGTVEFEIKTNYGLVIHYENYPSYYLIGYGLDSNASETEKADYIKNRILRFFDEENFQQPAILKNEIFEVDYSDREVWEDIKSDSTAVKFDYLIGEEGNGRIAYSKKLKKVVTIFSCC